MTNWDLRGASYSVTRIPHYELHLPGEDGTTIALKIWYPSSPSDDAIFFPGDWKRELVLTGEDDKEEERFPAILEYIPYRHSDFTVCRDESRHPWMASQGYVLVRADLRGSGNSGGLYFDEYTEIEQEDGVAIVEWLKDQGWCNGRVGLYGKSWGGFNGLQIAFKEPKGLASVISLYSTDNRYTDDIHYKGGCVIGSGMLSWASWMLADQAKPPHPLFCKNWKSVWINRLENTTDSWADIWLSKQKYDSYWANGSIAEDYDRVKIPVCIFGGWVDAYTNAAFRMADALPQATSTIGPWSHDWPDTSIPGPNINFLQKCLHFWDSTLKDSKAVFERTKVWYQCQGTLPPAEWVRETPGTWLTLKEGLEYKDAVKLMHFYIEANGPRTDIPSDENSHDLDMETTEHMDLRVDPLSAQEYSEYLSFGDPDQAGDLSAINAIHSDTWILELPQNGDKPFSILGQPLFECIVQGPQIIVRLCDVFPDERARLLSLGVMNLEGNKEKRKIQIAMDVLGYDVQPGHKLALSLSPMYFPLIWPPKSDPELKFFRAKLSIPQLVPETYKESSYDPGKPLILQRDPISKEIREPEYERNFNTLESPDGSVTYEWKIISDSGEEKLIHEDITSSEKREEVYTISSMPPFNPKATTHWSLQMSFPSPEPGDAREKVNIENTSSLSSDHENFILHHKIIVHHGGETLLNKEYEKVIHREIV